MEEPRRVTLLILNPLTLMMRILVCRISIFLLTSPILDSKLWKVPEIVLSCEANYKDEQVDAHTVIHTTTKVNISIDISSN